MEDCPRQLILQTRQAFSSYYPFREDLHPASHVAMLQTLGTRVQLIVEFWWSFSRGCSPQLPHELGFFSCLNSNCSALLTPMPSATAVLAV
jgi:hypothetical protein